MGGMESLILSNESISKKFCVKQAQGYANNSKGIKSDSGEMLLQYVLFGI